MINMAHRKTVHTIRRSTRKIAVSNDKSIRLFASSYDELNGDEALLHPKHRIAKVIKYVLKCFFASFAIGFGEYLILDFACVPS